MFIGICLLIVIATLDQMILLLSFDSVESVSPAVEYTLCVLPFDCSFMFIDSSSSVILFVTLIFTFLTAHPCSIWGGESMNEYCIKCARKK